MVHDAGAQYSNWIVKFESVSNTPTACTTFTCEYFHIFKNLLKNVMLILSTVCDNNTIF